MAYQALYRKWRPKVFEDVVGQDHIVTTLKNQIKSKNVSHAYLFSGTRGTGKTSTAKIFARAVNCLHPVEYDPCNECDVCRGIISESIMDVMEIDAASNNGVDHIRELRENVKYPPSRGRYKVYIIDEVHMLSTGAFNALLKTLEEPPSHVIFILATTEPQKLPATILSRCQRFDFKPVKVSDIIGLLSRICNKMNIKYEDRALGVIARNGKGGLRDSLSILDQCISFSKEELSYDEVMNTLGLTNEEVLLNLVDFIQKRESAEGLKLLQELIMKGKDIQLLIKDLIFYIRQLMLIRMKVYPDDYLQQSKEIQELMEKQSLNVNEGEILRYIYNLSEAEAKAKYSSQPQIILEVALVSLCNPQMDQSSDGLLKRIEELEKLVATGVSTYTPKDRQEKSPETGVTQAKGGTPPPKLATKVDSPMKESGNTSSNPLDYKKIKSKWPEVLELIRQNKKAQIKAFLMEGELLGVKGDSLIIGFKDGFGFHREALDKDKTKNYISEVIEKITGQQVQLSLVMETEARHSKSTNNSDPIDQLKNILPTGLLEIVED